MANDVLALQKEYSLNGYFVIKKFFSQTFISQLINDIETSKNTIKYFDKDNNLRRIEKLYDKGPQLNKLNDKITQFLNITFKKDFLIFKDKFNAKPPGGEGFFAHYDGIFHFFRPRQ